MQRVDGQGLHETGEERTGQVFYVEQSFAPMVTICVTDGDLLRTLVVRLVKDDEPMRECLSGRLVDRTKDSTS